MPDLSERYLGHNLQTWLTAAAVAVAVAFAILVLRTVVRRRRRALTETKPRGRRAAARDTVYDVVAHTRWWFAVAAGALAGRTLLTLEGPAAIWIRRALVVIALLQAGIWAGVLVRRAVDHRFPPDSEHPSLRTGASLVRFLGLLAVWSLVLLSALANVGVDVTALVAGLGVGGIAVALALQNVLGDLFGSISLLLDRPFVVGDFIIVGDLMGSVERIGLKTTRIRSLSGEQLIFANTDLLSSRVRNFARMRERRVVFRFGVVYETSADDLERIPELVRSIIEQQDGLRFDRAHFASFGTYALEFEAVYYVLDPDYALYMDKQQAINFALLRGLEARGIRFAIPTHIVRSPVLEHQLQAAS